MAQDGGQPDLARKRHLSDVLAEEFKAIKKDAAVNAAVGNGETLDAAMEAAGRAASARKPAPSDPDLAAELAKRKLLYRVGYELDLSALCLSGGGIRSASISLGVIQALVDHDLLDKFEYLSTVSGGGYIGSWLSAWLHRERKARDGASDQPSSEQVLKRLGSQRNNPDVEVPPLDHLREYSNYLTPKLGLFSADTWAAVAIVLRNILVNWLILVPVLALVAIGMKLLALELTTPSPHSNPPFWADPIVGAICLVAGSLAFGYKLGCLYLPAHSENQAVDGDEMGQGAQLRFLWRSLFPAIVGGLCFVWLAWNKTAPAVVFIYLLSWGEDNPTSMAGGLGMLCFAGLVYLLALALGAQWAFSTTKPDEPRAAGQKPPPRFKLGGRAFFSWLGGVLVFSLVVWAGAAWIKSQSDDITLASALCVTTVNACVAEAHAQLMALSIRREVVLVIFGMPWFLLATILAHSTYLLLNSGSPKGDVEREWLGRASGWHFIAALAWIMLAAIVLLGPELYYSRHFLGDNAGKWLAGLTAVSGAVTGLLGKSGLTSATDKSSSWKGFAANIALAIAGPLFAALMLILLSVVLDWAVTWNVTIPCLPTDGDWSACRAASWWAPARMWWLVIGGLSATLLLADRCANINAFSIHAIYRNRLIRCFLGGARDPHRHPDGFTDFDWDDDLRVAELWRLPLTKGEWRPFHVINMTLNLADTNRLAWQQRKGSAFSVTPLSCGNAELGYRRTRDYAGPNLSPEQSEQAGEIRSGISLGTAMAISGAAVSSNMGYHSSMSLSFLLTFFNVRLGVWLGNPGDAGQRPSLPFAPRPYEAEGPTFAVRPLLSELFGMTSSDSPYVYLSDGGHFEDLGLYEMVRRRCKWIVVVDGDQDGKRGFADLGNAVRKIWIDLGVRISFDGSQLLKADANAKVDGLPYFAVGTIDYLSDDPDAAERRPQGHLLYLKPVVRGDENAADVIAYQRANPAFPAQSTADQWFDESQFESYRRLGHLMMEQIILSSGLDQEDDPDLSTLFAGLRNIDQATMRPRQ